MNLNYINLLDKIFHFIFIIMTYIMSNKIIIKVLFFMFNYYFMIEF